ncbi:MAG: DNA (cytosine-5-)-methyltransferase [Lachnospiraceae bacterium]|nr:DNA (cytosine-5-)-methyltransferase [Lachnospiraceae bacterium]
MKDITVGSLFAGIGGIDLAFELEGAKVTWANEIDFVAGEVYRHNFKSILVNEDIRNIDSAKVPDIDILTAGFPCQPFSIMGKQRGFADSRGNLFFEIARIIKDKRPSVIFLENVKNLVAHDNGRTFKKIYHTLAELGYAIKYQVLNATQHGNLPQERSRIFVVAFRNISLIHQFSFPKEIALTKSINDVISRKEKKHDFYYYNPSCRYYDKLNEQICDKKNIYRIDDSGIAKRAWEISPTLKANMGTYPDRVPLIRDDFGIRKLTPYECLALQGFPESYYLPRLPIDGIYKAIGNTVAVPVVQRIARNIIVAATHL